MNNGLCLDPVRSKEDANSARAEKRSAQETECAQEEEEQQQYQRVPKKDKRSMNGEMNMDGNETNTRSTQQRIILFYKYHPLSSCSERMEPFRMALVNLCQSLQLIGRILIGCSDNGEGINGTLAGQNEHISAFTRALLGRQQYEADDTDTTIDTSLHPIFAKFWEENEAFAQSIHQPVLTMDSPDDFKWSTASSESGPLFPDLNIKLVKEMIGTGGSFSGISLDETSKGYLTPQEWHKELLLASSTAASTHTKEQEQETILIDCRNIKECSIGKFPNAIDPGTTNFAQFPDWVKRNHHTLSNKKVLMYCTGGIRCEKASAYIRQQVGSVKEVKHLKGGIHKYLEQYGGKGLWRGKNFVFDGRGATNAADTQFGKNDSGGGVNGDNTTIIKEAEGKNDNGSSSHVVIGRCLYCQCPHDAFDPRCVCTVCREPILVCTDCKYSLSEYHCASHFHLKFCYFTNLIPFTLEQLTKQLEELDKHLDLIRIGRRYKQKRSTLQKQHAKVQRRLIQLGGTNMSTGTMADGSNQNSWGTSSSRIFCRTCGDTECNGTCWGFHGLKRKEMLEKKGAVKNQNEKSSAACTAVDTNKTRAKRQSSNHRVSKELERKRMVEELQRLRLCLPPSEYRDCESGIRIPPPCTRVLRTLTKGKWCGKLVRHVLQQEFATLSQDVVLDELLEKGLVKLNDTPLTKSNAAQRELKNMDVISRVVHWHEPPVRVSKQIDVQKLFLPAAVAKDYKIVSSSSDDHTVKDGDLVVFCCNKPSSVPVHPAGPYLSNTLTLLVEAQEKLDPRSLIPCHRIDRVTSGITLCCTNVGIARLIQSKMDEGIVMKLYLARVQGKFVEMKSASSSNAELPQNSDYAKWFWHENTGSIQVDAPVKILDPQKGIRTVAFDGKASRSRFKFLSYDLSTNSTLIACCPITGRGHQLRVHLQWLGFPIWDDVQYGGTTEMNQLDQLDQVVPQMITSINMEIFPECARDDIANSDLKAAKEACRICRNGSLGIKESFTPAQLLKTGHSISLHAFRYRIPIPRKKISKDPENDGPLAVIEVEASEPEWAKLFGPQTTTWLQDWKTHNTRKD